MPLARNFVLHESAHVVASQVVFGSPKEFRRARKSSTFIPRTLLCESFANACEILALAAIQDPVHAYFALMNLHYAPDPKSVRAIRRLVSDFGARKGFRFLLLGFLYSNFLYQSLGPKDEQRLFALAFGSDSSLSKGPARKNLREILSHLVFALSKEFRLNTTRMYFLYNGYAPSALRNDPGVLLERTPALMNAAESLDSAVTRKLEI